MSAPTTNKANKATTTKGTDKVSEATESPVEVIGLIPVSRIPEALAENPILDEFCKQYLVTVDEILAYNKQVLAEKTAEWNAHKVMEKAREFARPTDKSEADEEILKALKEYEAAQDAYNLARRSVLDATANKLGITLSATADRNPEIEAPLKEKRKTAHVIGTQLKTIADMTSNEKASAAVEEFLSKYELPMIGRDQTHSFGDSGKATPKYRVTVVVTDSDGKELLSEKGFTNTAMALTKFYERGKALKSETLREVWEKAGNTPEETKTSPVEFNDNDLHFVITKN